MIPGEPHAFTGKVDFIMGDYVGFVLGNDNTRSTFHELLGNRIDSPFETADG